MAGRGRGGRPTGGGPPGGGPPGSGSGRRGPAVRVRTARGRKPSSTRWLQRQLNDPWIEAARREGYRSRAAWKLVGLDDRFGLLRAGARVLDLGAAPGGWSQIAADRVGAVRGRGRVVAVDTREIDALPGVVVLVLDIAAEDAPGRIAAALGGPADIVLSDMAPEATGHTATDHLRIMALADLALDMAERVLAPGGTLLVKVWQGGGSEEFVATLRQRFRKVRHVRPPASRSDSSEIFLLATGWRGAVASGDQTGG